MGFADSRADLPSSAPDDEQARPIDEGLEVLGEMGQAEAGGVVSDPGGDQLTHAAPTNVSGSLAFVAGSAAALSVSVQVG